MNQEDRNSGGCDGIFRRDLLHVEVVLPADVEESEFACGAKNGPSEPGTEVKGLTHAVVGDLAEAGERRFGCDRAEAGLHGKGLQELSCAHGLTESVSAAWASLGYEEVVPLADVVAFEKAVGGECAAACAVGARIGQKHCESMNQEELRIPGHADTVVGEAVEENHGIAIAAVGMDDPGAKSDPVWGGDGNV